MQLGGITARRPVTRTLCHRQSQGHRSYQSGFVSRGKGISIRSEIVLSTEAVYPKQQSGHIGPVWPHRQGSGRDKGKGGALSDRAAGDAREEPAALRRARATGADGRQRHAGRPSSADVGRGRAPERCLLPAAAGGWRDAHTEADDRAVASGTLSLCPSCSAQASKCPQIVVQIDFCRLLRSIVRFRTVGQEGGGLRDKRLCSCS